MITYGTVITVNPLSIRIDDKNVLPANYFIVAGHLKGLELDLSELLSGLLGDINISPIKANTYIKANEGLEELEAVPESSNDVPEHNHEFTHSHDISIPEISELPPIILFKPLVMGERVVLLSFNGGKKYYVAERVD